MTLDRQERRATSEELAANLARSGLTADRLAADLGLDRAALEAALRVAPTSDPVDVWLLRDHLERAVVAAGGRPVPYSVLTEAARDAARRWFPLRTAP